MYYSKKSIARFLKGSKTLIFGVRDDAFIKERITAFNYDESRLTECIAIYDEAEKAESVKSKEYGEQLEAKAIFDKQMAEAEKLYRKHTDFLKLALVDNIEEQKKLLLIGQPRTRRLSDWFKHVLELYDRVLESETAITAVTRYGITREKLAEGRQTVSAAEAAKIKHTEEKGEAQDATDLRDTAFEKLAFAVDELKKICTYSLEDRPQRLEKLGIQVLSPGYKRKPKNAEEEQGEEVVVPAEISTAAIEEEVK